MQKPLVIGLVAIGLCAASVDAQMAHRLKGSLRNTAGAPLANASIRARALLGAGGAALLARDWEGAGKIIWDARDVVPKEQRQALAAAIDDLRAIMRVQ